MRQFFFVVTLLTSMYSSAASAQSQAPQHDIRSQTEALVTLMKNLPSKPEDAIRTGKLDSFFNFKSLTQAPIAPYVKSLKIQERKKIEAVFGQLVRHLAYASGDSMRRGEVTVAPALRTISDQRQASDVSISSADDDVDNQVSFVWEQSQGQWRVVDVELDGASVVKDYENQFGKIIKKDGASGLLKRMQARLSEAQRRELEPAKKP